MRTASFIAILSVVMATVDIKAATPTTSSPSVASGVIKNSATTQVPLLLQQDTAVTSGADVRVVTELEYNRAIKDAQEAYALAISDQQEFEKLLKRREISGTTQRDGKLVRDDKSYYVFNDPIMEFPTSGRFGWVLFTPDGQMIHGVNYDCQKKLPHYITVVTDVGAGEGVEYFFQNGMCTRIMQMRMGNQYRLFLEWDVNGELIHAWYRTRPKPTQNH